MIKNLLLLIASMLLGFLLLEAGIRIKSYWDAYDESTAFRELENHNAKIDTTKNASLRDLVRHSNSSGIIYELKPNLCTRFKDEVVRTNQYGFRGPGYSMAKPDNTIRILGLGDSVMFGWGVKDNESVLSLISVYLNRRYPNYNWETINTAVPGYNTAMQIATLQHKGIFFDPDLVIVSYLPNDLRLPNFLYTPPDYFGIHKSYLADFVSSRFQSNHAKKTPLLAATPAEWVHRNTSLKNADRIPDAFKYMVGYTGYANAMRTFKEIQNKQGFESVVFAVEYTEKIRSILADTGISFCDAAPVVHRYMQDKNIANYRQSIIVLNKSDPHPSAIGHQLLADAIISYLEGNGILKKVIEAHEASASD